MSTESISASDIRNADPKRCWVDGVKNVSDQHHIVPVEFGGPADGLTVPLCPTCHRNIHREAEHQFKKKESGEFVNDENYPDFRAKERALLLSRYVLQSKVKFVETGRKKAEGARNMLQVSFEADELAMAHDLKRMMGMRSLSRMVKRLVLDEWMRRKTNKK